MSNDSVKHIHANPPQLKSMIVRAPFEWDILGRGTGKSEVILAEKSVYLMESMPRSRGVFVASTFTQLLTRTLPPIISGWERMGYIQDKHFFVGKKPPEEWRKKFNWKGPFKAPLNFDYFISWWNGSGIQLISQDRAGSSNGMSVDWIMGDEVKLLNKERLEQELFPANRGLCLDFANNPHHHGMTFTTDMPKGTAGRWILEKEQLMDKKKVAAVITLATKKYQFQQELKSCKVKSHINKIGNYIIELDKAMNMLRKGLVLYQEASSLENIHALGIDYIHDLMRNLPAFEFRTAILNQRPYKLEDGFYPTLDEEKHGYFSYDYHHTFEKHGYNFDVLSHINDCRRDGDIDSSKPLHIAIDYNRRIWPIVTGQPHKGEINELRILSGKHELFPKGYRDALNTWSDYYKPHPKKIVYFWYDHTALNGEDEPMKEKIVKHLRSLGWVVIEKYIGKTTNQDYRYTEFHDILSETRYPWKVRMNRDNCDKLLLSLFQSQAKEKEKGYGKNKSTERDKNFPADESTHYSDAFDTLVIGIIKSGLTIEDGGFKNTAEVR